jgi:hypothetical protein
MKQDFNAISSLERDSYVTVNTNFLHYKVKLVNGILFAVGSENMRNICKKKKCDGKAQYFKVKTDGTHSKPCPYKA